MDNIYLFSSLSSLPLAMFLFSVQPATAQENEPAQSSPYEVNVTHHEQAIVLPEHEYKLIGWAFDDIRGEYDMENGMRLSMSSHGHSYFADLDGFDRTELVAVAPDIFVAKNKTMKMVFKQHPNGVATAVTLTYLAKNPGSAELTPVTLVGKVD